MPLSETGKQLEAEYTKRMEALQAKLLKALPDIEKARMAAYESALEAEKAAQAALDEVLKGQKELNKRRGAVGHGNRWIAGTEKVIRETKLVLENNPSPEEKAAAEERIAAARKSMNEGIEARDNWQAELDAALKKYATIEEDQKKAEANLELAKADTIRAIRSLGLRETLASDRFDAELAAYSVMAHATPHGLAAYSQNGKKEQKRIEQLLASGDLLVDIAVADGASGAHYGPAMEIYEAILETSDRAKEGNLRRLALAVSLEHATPIKQRNAKARSDAPEFVDPVKRYLHYEQAFLDGELDPAFKDLSVWDYRFVVNGQEPDEILAWGREMLRNYRPDHITMDDYRWRYVALVRSDIRYGSQDNKYDREDLQFFQNILMNGGICGRRAFIGRFMLRAFGIPTTARPQRGHAALAHWTPDGWVVCLGGGWGVGWTKTRYKDDLDFLATTQGRATGESYKKVMRAHWIGEVYGEERIHGFISHKDEIPVWNAVALYTQLDLIKQSEAKTLAAVGEDIGEANVTKEKIDIAAVEITAEDRKIHSDEQGSIIVPAAATTKPTESTGKIIFTESVLGGKQLHYSRNGDDESFAYTFDVPAAGKYKLTAHVVTPSWKQNLLVSANGENQAKISLPHTVGMWERTEPVTIQLRKGKNILEFSHQTDGYAKGFSIKEFRLTPSSGLVSR